MVKQINAFAKEKSAPFVEVITSLKRKASDYRTSEEVRAKEMQRNRLEAEAKSLANQGDMEGAVIVHKASEQVAEEVSKTVTTDDATVRFRTDYVIDSVDLATLPDFYVIRTANNTAIKSALRDGVEVQGVKFHIERTPIVYQN
jgi:hypothetical protein